MGGNSLFSGYDLSIRGDKVYVPGSPGLTTLPLFTPPEESVLNMTSLPAGAPATSSFSVQGIVNLDVGIQRSPDLVTWEDWLPLTLGATPQVVLDGSASSAIRRFYRATVR